MPDEQFHPRHELDDEYVLPVTRTLGYYHDGVWDYVAWDATGLCTPATTLEPLDRREFRESMDRVAEQLLRLQESVVRLSEAVEKMR